MIPATAMELADNRRPADGSCEPVSSSTAMSPTITRHLNARRLLDLGAVLGGGFLGSGTRLLVAQVMGSSTTAFPWPTLTVNLVGAALAGFYLARRQRAVASRWSLRFWAIGVLGSLTTFSGFSVEVVRLGEAGRIGTAAAYVTASVVGGVVAAIVGDSLGRARW